MRKIVHITDLHIGAQSCRAVIQDVVANIVNHLDPAAHAVVLTGDIVDKESPGALNEAWNTVLKPLVTTGFPLLNVPGNHDFGNGWEVFPQAVNDFDQIVGPSPFPTIKVDSMDGLTFIGLDSQRERLHWIGQPEQPSSVYEPQMVNSDGLQGWISEAQRTAISATVNAASAKGDKIIVYLHHDPLYQLPTMGLGNYNQLEPLIRNQTTMLLCGHSHKFVSRCGEWGIPHFYNGGTTGGKDTYPSPVRIIDPTAAQGVYEVL